MPVPSMASSGIMLAGFAIAVYMAHDIRCYALRTYGLVIHEFDPWFNYRATEYLAEHGWHAFFHWFDYESWYPLGRPVGTTIYPGMQISAVGIWKAINAAGTSMSLNDVCCYVPVWFGCSASIFLGLLTLETSGSKSAAAISAIIMAIVPAHIMRSVGGGYDNESIAMTAMCMTFFFWCRSLRATSAKNEATQSTYVYGTLCGFAYIYMVMAWGGYVFVVNMIGLHAAALVVCGRFSEKVHRAYSLFYVIGTLGAMRVPPVGYGPIKSMEQLMPLLVFFGFQILEAVRVARKRDSLTPGATLKVLAKLAIPAAVLLFVVAIYLSSIGYFGPLTARVRGLFLKHTRTGNPLVDSVAEHQPGSTAAYMQYMHHIYYLAPFGFIFSLTRWTDSNSFILLYALTAYYFASKMSRLIILLGPVGAVLGGVALGYGFDFLVCDSASGLLETMDVIDSSVKDAKVNDRKKSKEDKKKRDEALGRSFGKKKRQGGRKESGLEEVHELLTTLVDAAGDLKTAFLESTGTSQMLGVRLAVGIGMVIACVPYSFQFYSYSHNFAEQSSQPQIMFKAQLHNGQTIIVDDYREAYHWLRDKTPKDARVMAWWDYGYQITGIGQRTSIADGNTWNHEHIATLGRMLTAPEDEAHTLIRHMADYVLVWAGGGGDDLAKSPHLARIGNSVYPGHCSDPTCSQFGFTSQERAPTPMMAKSLLYKLCSHGQKGVTVNETYFKHAFSSKYGKVRIYQVKAVSRKSKEWVADPQNKLCDAPGSWYCVGQYPPAIKEFINSRRDFKQVEDFNVKKDDHAKKYHEEYMRRMGGN